MSFYYEKVFPQGWGALSKHLKETERILSTNPYIGHSINEVESVRQLIIHKSPFALIYRVVDTHIEILRVWDMRKDNANMRLE